MEGVEGGHPVLVEKVPGQPGEAQAEVADGVEDVEGVGHVGAEASSGSACRRGGEERTGEREKT